MTTELDPDDVLAPSQRPPVQSPAAGGWFARWARAQAERPWTRSMLVFGVIAPLVLFAIDRDLLPRSILPEGEGIAPFRPYSTLMMAAGVAVMTGWLLIRRRQGWGGAVLAGPLLLGAAFALAMGLILLPFSLMGIVWAGLGLLGLIPFWTALVFFRAAAVAYVSARRRLDAGPVVAMSVLATLVVGMGVVGSGRLAKLVELRASQIVLGERDGDPGRAELVLSALYVFPQVVLGELRDRADEESGFANEPGRAALAYERITGRHVPISD